MNRNISIISLCEAYKYPVFVETKGYILSSLHYLIIFIIICKNMQYILYMLCLFAHTPFVHISWRWLNKEEMHHVSLHF